MAAAGRGHLRRTGRTPAFHALQGPGVGRLRSGRQDGSDRRSRQRAGSPLAPRGQRNPRGRVPGMPTIRASAASCSPTAPGNRREPARQSRWSGFYRPRAPRVVGTVAAIERHLSRRRSATRYDTGTGEDGLPPGEGTFLACSFWLADVLVLLGRDPDEARRLFERLLSLCNDVGKLLAEEYDPLHGRMLGNFPQAFSHIGLINTALNLTRISSPAEGGRTGRRCHPAARLGWLARSATFGQRVSGRKPRLP